jgi:hypothetical protein
MSNGVIKTILSKFIKNVTNEINDNDGGDFNKYMKRKRRKKIEHFFTMIAFIDKQ